MVYTSPFLAHIYKLSVGSSESCLASQAHHPLRHSHFSAGILDPHTPHTVHDLSEIELLLPHTPSLAADVPAYNVPEVTADEFLLHNVPQ